MNDNRWRLVLHNIRLVVNIAIKFPTNVLDLEDLVQEGIPGLITAPRKNDVSRGNRFSTYAWYWIRQGIFRAMGNNQNLIRWPIYRQEELVPANLAGDTMHLSLGERRVKPLDDSEIESSESFGYLEDDYLQRDERIEALLASVESLNERQQRILQLRFGLGSSEDYTLEEVGLGKSYVGAATVKHFERTHHSRPLVVCPASLANMWERYNEVDQLNARVLSMGKLRDDHSLFKRDGPQCRSGHSDVLWATNVETSIGGNPTEYCRYYEPRRD